MTLFITVRRVVLGTSLLLLAACGGQQNVLGADPTLDERLNKYRAVLRQMQTSPYADQASVELERAALWLRRAESKRDITDADEEELDLLLSTIDGQLVRLRSAFAERRAKDELESRRAAYEATMKKINDYRRENERILRQAGGEG